MCVDTLTDDGVAVAWEGVFELVYQYYNKNGVCCALTNAYSVEPVIQMMGNYDILDFIQRCLKP